MIIVRYADDFIVGFQHDADAALPGGMRARMEAYALSLHLRRPLIELDASRKRPQPTRARQAGDLQLLGFTFIAAIPPG